MGIVTIPCETEHHRAVSFNILGVYDDRVFIVDLSAAWNGYATVVDAAYEILEYCSTKYGTKRVICEADCDSWVEIVPTGSAFGISPYQGKVPIMVEFKSLTARDAIYPPAGSP